MSSSDKDEMSFGESLLMAFGSFILIVMLLVNAGDFMLHGEILDLNSAGLSLLSLLLLPAYIQL